MSHEKIGAVDAVSIKIGQRVDEVSQRPAELAGLPLQAGLRAAASEETRT